MAINAPIVSGMFVSSAVMIELAADAIMSSISRIFRSELPRCSEMAYLCDMGIATCIASGTSTGSVSYTASIPSRVFHRKLRPSRIFAIAERARKRQNSARVYHFPTPGPWCDISATFCRAANPGVGAIGPAKGIPLERSVANSVSVYLSATQKRKINGKLVAAAGGRSCSALVRLFRRGGSCSVVELSALRADARRSGVPA